MQETIKKIEDDDLIEWIHETNDEILGVSASQELGDENWSVFISVAEFVQEDPLEGKLRKLIVNSLSSVDGVSCVEEEDREVWLVEGSTDGKELVKVCVQSLTSIYDELSEYMNEI